MSNNKNDLTRIEDLGEFIHELNNEDDTLEESSSEFEVPDLPSEFEESSNSEEENSDFSLSESNDSVFEENTTEDTFSSDFNSSSDSSDFVSVEAHEEESSDSTDNNWNQSPNKEDEEMPTPLSFSESDNEPSLSEKDYQIEEDRNYSFEVSTPLSISESKSEYKTPETFDDLKKFSESSTLTDVATEANPSFSILVKNVRFIEDVTDIVTLLKEFNLLVDSEEQTKSRLMRGMVLIPRISEFSATYLAHKLRRFDVDIQVGLSDEIHPPKHQENPEIGIVSRHNLYQNQSHHFQFDDSKIELSQIIISSTSGLDGHQIIKYLGIASEHKIIDGQLVEDENSKEVTTLYHELAQKLKAHAIKAQANAVVGLNYQLTPLPSEYGLSSSRYRLTCSGNLVWINKI